jgi:hypothetical protein
MWDSRAGQEIRKMKQLGTVEYKKSNFRGKKQETVCVYAVAERNVAIIF